MHNMKVENGVVALLAVTSYAGTGSAGALASSAVESATAAAPSGGAKDTPCWGLSPVGRVLGGASGRGGRKLGQYGGCCSCWTAAPLRPSKTLLRLPLEKALHVMIHAANLG